MVPYLPHTIWSGLKDLGPKEVLTTECTARPSARCVTPTSPMSFLAREPESKPKDQKAEKITAGTRMQLQRPRFSKHGLTQDMSVPIPDLSQGLLDATRRSTSM